MYKNINKFYLFSSSFLPEPHGIPAKDCSKTTTVINNWNLKISKMKTSTEYTFKSLDPSQIVVKSIKILKLLKVSVKQL